MPGDSEKVTTTHALCYAGVNGLNLEFDAEDSFDGISEGLLKSIKKNLAVDDLSTLLPKKKGGLSLGRGRKKTPKVEAPVEESEESPSEDSE
jgi:hypothetical protein